MNSPVILWYRHDLRLRDHAALTAAAAGGRPVVPVFVLDTAADGAWVPGGASRWWLHHSLAELQASLAAIGSRLVLRRGATADVLCDIAAETGARSLHVTRGYEPCAARLEQTVLTACSARGIEVRRFSGALIAEPETLRTGGGQPFRVFTPFWRALRAAGQTRPPLPPPDRLTAPSRWPEGDHLDEWRLLPRTPDWAGGLRATWSPGEKGAAGRLATMITDALADYANARDRPDRPGTSMLSPHLHFGEISPRQIWHAVALAEEREPSLAAGANAFLREVGWREFSAHLLHHWPSLPEAPFRADFADFPWEPDDARRRASFAAWSRGLTGYPIVDAGMRQLWQTGWMHNRVRMVTASFLTKHLLVPWQCGARWFWDTLVDADLASNSASWQWVAGCGADAAPYFRIFNPVLQSQKFDPEGDYVRRFVPQLGRMPAKHIHAPWAAPPDVLAAAGVTLGQTYPLPIVDHHVARQRALAAHAVVQAGAASPGRTD